MVMEYKIRKETGISVLFFFQSNISIKNTYVNEASPRLVYFKKPHSIACVGAAIEHETVT